MVGDADHVEFDLHSMGRPLVAGARRGLRARALQPEIRRQVAPVLHRAMRWRGPIGPSFVADITGVSRTDLVGITDPRAWALDLLGFPMGTAKVTKKEVMARFRSRLARGASRPRRRRCRRRRSHRAPGRGPSNPAGPADMTDCCCSPVPAAPAPIRAWWPSRQRWRPMRCVRADFPYRQAGRKAPDRPPVLLQAVRDAGGTAAAAQATVLVLGGRSMGGRICSWRWATRPTRCRRRAWC